MRNKFVSCSKQMKKVEPIKKPLFFDAIPLTSAGLFTAKCYPSPFGIIKIITCFPRFEFCFET